MQNRRPSRPRRGQTVPAQGETQAQETVPRLPHERDESSSRDAPAEASTRRVGEAAHDDVEAGRVDTTKGAEMDATYRKVKGS